MGVSEVYGHAPLAMVVAEVQFTHEPDLSELGARDRALASLRDDLPILANKRVLETPLLVAGRETPAEFTAREFLEAMSVDGQTLVTIGSESLSVSMSGKAYHHYEDTLGPLIERVLDGAASAMRRVAVRRIGLRYIDEVRAPVAPDDVSGWREWINPALLAGGDAPIQGTARDAKSIYMYELEKGARVQFTAGTFDGNTVLTEDHPFATKVNESGPMFVIDIDASWQPMNGFELFDASKVKSTFDTLHEPTSGLFEWAITEKARELFRRVS